jgi:hypothetical protein
MAQRQRHPRRRPQAAAPVTEKFHFAVGRSSLVDDHFLPAASSAVASLPFVLVLAFCAGGQLVDEGRDWC